MSSVQNSGRRKSSVDKEKLAKLQQMKIFQQTGGVASKLLKIKASANEGAAAALSLSKMARKKGGEVSMQIEIETEAQFKLLLRREGLIVVEVYAGWCGPCVSLVSTLKKVKVDTNDDKLTLATVCSDNVSEYNVFKGQSEPAFVFYGGGKPVKLLRGVNSGKIVDAIKSEFKHELLCMERKAKRTLICIKDEVQRREKAESQAILLANAKKQEDRRVLVEDRKAIKFQTQSPSLRERSTSPQENPVESEDETNNSEKMEIITDQGSESLLFENPLDKKITDSENTVDQIEKQLLTALLPLTVIAIQGFLLETGAVTEIKDLLQNDFNILRERYIFLDDAGVRDLFGIPYEVEEEVPKEELEAMLIVEGENNDENQEDQEEDIAISVMDPQSSQTEEVEKQGEERKKDEDEEVNELKADSDANNEEERVHVPRYKKIPVPLPEELIGDTLLFLLESVKVVKEKENDSDAVLSQTADDYIRSMVGSNFQEAVTNNPKSLIAIYGREEYAVGVWSPKDYKDKSYVLLNFFPQIITELLMQPQPLLPKYRVAVFPSLFSNEIMENPELLTHQKDIIATKKSKLPSKLVERMLKSHGDASNLIIEAQKKALAEFDMFVVSINERNEDLGTVLQSLEPLHFSVDDESGKYETAKLFPHLNILIDNDEDEIIKSDIIVKTFLARPKIKFDVILDDDGEDY